VKENKQHHGVNIPQFAISIILAIVVASMLIMVAGAVTLNVSSSMPSLTGAANITTQPIYDMVNATYSGLNLVTVLPIVLVAALIISLVVGSFMCLRSSGACE
jgi:hypothetical protein